MTIPAGILPVGLLAGGKRRPGLWQQIKLHPLWTRYPRGESPPIGAFWHRGVAARWRTGRSAKQARGRW